MFYITANALNNQYFSNTKLGDVFPNMTWNAHPAIYDPILWLSDRSVFGGLAIVGGIACAGQALMSIWNVFRHLGCIGFIKEIKGIMPLIQWVVAISFIF